MQTWGNSLSSALNDWEQLRTIKSSYFLAILTILVIKKGLPVRYRSMILGSDVISLSDLFTIALLGDPSAHGIGGVLLGMHAWYTLLSRISWINFPSSWMERLLCRK